MRARSSEDFASSAMVRVLMRGMLALGYETPVPTGALTKATVALNVKRAVVQSAIAQGGFACLPLLGRGLHDLAMEPTHLALTSGGDAASMLIRWQRLERYIHSQHRIKIDALSDNTAEIEHVHKNKGAPPLAVEDLVVCGVLCALLKANGLQSVHAQSHGVELFPRPKEALISQIIHAGHTGQWRLSWQLGDQQRISGLDRHFSWSHNSPKVWTTLASAVGELVAKRLPERITVDEAARKMSMSGRSLQRALASDGVSFQQLQGEVRFRLAGWHLLHQTMPIAEVGYVCGYSDQAHLGREFNKRLGIPPAKYRALFANR